MTSVQSAALAQGCRRTADPAWFNVEADMESLANTAHRMGIVPDPMTWSLIHEIRRGGLTVSHSDLTMCPGSYAGRLPGEQHCRVCGQRVIRSDWTPEQTPGGFVGKHDPEKGVRR